MVTRQGRQEQADRGFSGSTTVTVRPRHRTLVRTHRTDTSDPDVPCSGARALAPLPPKRNHSHEKPRHTTVERPPLSTEREQLARPRRHTEHAPTDIKYVQRSSSETACLRSDASGQYLVPSLGKLPESSVDRHKETLAHCAMGSAGSSPYSAESTVET